MKCRHCGVKNPRKSVNCPSCGLPQISNRQYLRHAGDATGNLCRICGVSLPGASLCPNCGIPFGMVLDIRDSTLSSLINANTANVQVRQPLNVESIPEGVSNGWRFSSFVLTAFFTAVHKLWWYWVYCLLLGAVWLVAFTLRTANPQWTVGGEFLDVSTLITALLWLTLKVLTARDAGRLAWKSGRYRDTDRFASTRTKWFRAAILYVAVLAVCSALAILVH